jgi:hypothetical protein
VTRNDDDDDDDNNNNNNNNIPSPNNERHIMLCNMKTLRCCGAEQVRYSEYKEGGL